MDRERKREMDRRTGLGTEGQRVRERGTGRGIGRGGQWTDMGTGTDRDRQIGFEEGKGQRNGEINRDSVA